MPKTFFQLKAGKKAAAQTVVQGNEIAEIEPNAVVETASRKFADFLLANYDLKETGTRVEETPAVEEVSVEAEITEEN